MNYFQFDFDIENAEQLEKLVALLAEQGFEGFEESEDNLDAFIPEQKFDEAEFSRIIDFFPTVSYTKTVVENINWNKRWEEDFKPVMVDNFVAIRASFHSPIPNVAHQIIITPKMSFGTGHHATTYLMISQMQHIDFIGKSVLDFGTGTGILAILASKLGAAKVVAIDYDEWSIGNAKENITQNECVNIQVEQLDEIPVTQKFDIVLANINLNVIVSNMEAIVKASFTGATILLSGFLKENEADLKEVLEKAGLQFFNTMQRGDWIVVMAKSE
ncbi:MAG: ribosomal protein L11P-lysine N-methyltransferase [Ferruginibacter sp.]|nr:ribosomal protein L11P-lysine N-methyltransferase [Ferruginibacter sp.]